jgi:hypothetical protein
MQIPLLWVEMLDEVVSAEDKSEQWRIAETCSANILVL